jgi:surface carbohydrate biosynthesis protein
MKKKKLLRIGKPTILLSIETKVREFPGKVLLSCFLAENGFRVILTNHRRASEVIRYSAWLFIDRNTFATRVPFFKRLKILRVKIACLDEEGIVFANPDIYLKRLSSESMKRTDLFFTWGGEQTELVNRLNRNSTVLETGNPRMDLLRPELRLIYSNKADLLKNQYGDFILIVSNFAWNNHYYGQDTNESPADSYIKLMRRQGHIVNNDDENFHRANLAYKSKIFEKLKELVSYLSHRFPDLTIIVRPHPSEKHEEWEKSFENHKNIKIVFEGELESWILAARAVIHNSCTSGLLAALLNKESIAFMPFTDIRFDHELPNSVSLKASTEKETGDLVQSSSVSQDIPDFLNAHISSLTGPLAAEKIADAILDYYNYGFSEIISAILTRLIKLFPLKNIGKNIKSALPGKVAPELRKKYKEQKFDFITSEEVTNYIELYRKQLNRFSNVIAKEIDGTVEIKLGK